MSYDHKSIEPKWQKKWEEANVFETKLDSSKPKYYVLDMFPYPSASGLHVGHPEGYTATDILARYKRCKGFNVLHPMGFDAFGLPAEQYAIKTGVHPEVTTYKAMESFRRQLKALGFSYDWSREVVTCDPKFYKWTQFIFKKLYERGLAYQKEVPVNWCPALKTVLANEEVVDGKSERGGHPVVRMPMKQWMLKITDYAEKLLEGLDKIDWPERTKEGQRNWIGKSVGAEVDFAIEDFEQKIRIFTTRPDTLFGATFMVLAPEHPLVLKILKPEQEAAVKEYIDQSSRKSEIDRQANQDKTGCFTGAYARHPLSNEKLPIWISDYVLMGYGTGAIMCVPAHDERDFEFAKKFDLKIQRVLEGGELPFTEDGKLVNSEFLDGMQKQAAIDKMISVLEEKNLGKKSIQYKLRDWLFSRQRFWGEPFPILHYPEGDLKTVPNDELPVLLPEVANYEPSDQGDSPLANNKEWLNYKDKDGKTALRDTDTMPGSAASSWYFLRYCDPNNDVEAFSKESQDYWMPVDLYIGGPEHTVGHLLYSRFWQKVLFDAGMVSHDEPFQKLVHQGMILGDDGEKMSKSRGNTINPDDVIEELGADSLRMYEMFMGPLEKDKPWSMQGIQGVRRFLDRIWRLLIDEEEQVKVVDKEPTEEILKLLHKTIKKVSHDIENLGFNTAISQMMIFINEMYKQEQVPKSAALSFVQVLAPFAPHFCEELWKLLGQEGFVSVAKWPEFDEKYCQEDEITIGVQVNGKRRGEIQIAKEANQEQAMAKAGEVASVQAVISDAEIRKVIYVPGRILNIIAK